MMTIDRGAVRIARARALLREVEDAVIEGDFEGAAEAAERLINLATNLAVNQAEGYVAVLEIMDELQDVKGFPFRD